ncbi:MAG: STAS domain-containing protein [Burkholderiaceae bacterium]
MPVSTVPPTEIQRELARQTAEKIDRIESEMIAASLPVPPAPRRVQQRIEAVRAGADGLDPMTLPPLEMPTDIVGSVPDEEFRIVEGPLAPEFEEAAILFANGQGEAAAATLASVLVVGNELVSSQQGWMMLLDVYQSLGSQDAFEAAAIAYAARFEVSPPAWRGEHADADPAPERSAPPARGGGLGVAVMARLDESFARSCELAVRAQQGKRSVTVDLTAVRQVDATGVSLLLDLIRRFKAGGGRLTLVGAAALLDAIRPLVPVGRRDDGEDIWMLALELLRVQGLRTEFDDLSIDYCVTFEVSPPPWEPMPDNVREASAGDAQAAGTGPGDDEAASGSSIAPFATTRGHPLAGQIAGRAQKELEALRAHAENRGEVVIDCRDLVRLDFVAAGELLNEIVSMRSAGKAIVFVDVSAIVAALLSVMGIPDLAEIRKRRI